MRVFFLRLGHHTDYIDEHALPDRMVSFAGTVGHLFILCHPQRLKIMRRVFIIFGTVRGPPPPVGARRCSFEGGSMVLSSSLEDLCFVS